MRDRMFEGDARTQHFSHDSYSLLDFRPHNAGGPTGGQLIWEPLSGYISSWWRGGHG